MKNMNEWKVSGSFLDDVDQWTVEQSFSETKVVEFVSKKTQVDPSMVKAVLHTLDGLVRAHVRSNQSYVLLNRLLKISTVETEATEDRESYDNFSGEMRTYKGKPASKSVRVRVLKNLKEAMQE